MKTVADTLGVSRSNLADRLKGSHAMLLEKHTTVRKYPIHDGKATVMRSNLSWCSNGLKFACWIGEVIPLAVHYRRLRP